MFKGLTLNKITGVLLLLFLFLLPWQTRWRYVKATINGDPWEYGSESLYATEIVGWLMVILFFVMLFRQGEFLHRVKQGFASAKARAIPFAAVMYLVAVALASSSSRISISWANWLIFGLCISIVIAHADIPWRTLFVAFWAGGVVQGVFAIYQFLYQEIFASRWLGLAYHSAKQLGDFVVEFGDERWLRAYGSFGSPNILGGYLVLCLLAGLIMQLKQSGGKVLSYALTIGQLFVAAGILLSFSRGAWLAAIVGVGALGIILVSTPHNQKPVDTLKNFVRHLLPPSILTILVFFALMPLFITRIKGVEELERRSTYERVHQVGEWKEVFKKDILFGTGPGTYTLELYRANPHKPAWRYQPVHNTYLLMLAEVGIVGVWFVFAIAFFILRLVWLKNPLSLSLLVSIAVSGMFDHFWWSLYAGVTLFFVVVGLSFKSGSPETLINS